MSLTTSCLDLMSLKTSWIDLISLMVSEVRIRAGVCRPCVETELTATKKSETDGN